jgi:RNA polymerase sigma-70 factor (ECF subfamily)
MDQRNDHELIVAYRNGENAALSALITRHTDAVHRFLVRMVGDVHAAEDLTQETFLKAWRHLGRFDRTKSFKTWIFSIARNAAIDHLRKKDPIAFSRLETDEHPDFSDTIADSRPLADDILQLEDIGRRLEAALGTLKPNARAVILMHETEDMTFQEIADAVHEPMDTVKSRYRRAIAVVRSVLEGQG